MRDNLDYRQGQRWRRVADYCGGGDARQHEQRRQIYENMDTAAEDMP